LSRGSVRDRTVGIPAAVGGRSRGGLTVDRTTAVLASLAVCVGIGGIVGSAAAESEGLRNQGWYAGIAAGLSIAPDPIDDSGTVISGTNTFQYTNVLSTDPGFVIDGAFGYKLRSGWRFDLEVGYRRNSLDRYDQVATGSIFGGSGFVRSIPLDGSISSVSYMIDVWYDFQIADHWMPYVGLGIGGVTVLADDPSNALLVPDWTHFGFQLGAGLGYAFNDKTVVTVDYRYVESIDIDSFVLAFFGEYVDYRTHNVTLGIRRHFSFGGG
jgi:opacity protein-like surface antigen